MPLTRVVQTTEGTLSATAGAASLTSAELLAASDAREEVTLHHPGQSGRVTFRLGATAAVLDTPPGFTLTPGGTATLRGAEARLAIQAIASAADTSITVMTRTGAA